jgi:hypothetical protein
MIYTALVCSSCGIRSNSEPRWPEGWEAVFNGLHLCPGCVAKVIEALEIQAEYSRGLAARVARALGTDL